MPSFAQEAPRAPTQPLAIPPPATAKPAPPPPGPTPRRPDGSVILGSLPSDNGIWVGDGRLAVNPKSYEPKSTANAPIHIDAIPLQDWARALVDARHGESLRTEPHPRCKPSGGPRQFITPYGFEILELPEIKRVYVWDIGGPHSFRVIYTDGRPHPKDLEPTYYGHSVGRWEGDTLVVDAVGFSEKFWFSRDGLPHTDQLHLTERITRTNMNTLRYESDRGRSRCLHGAVDEQLQRAVDARHGSVGIHVSGQQLFPGSRLLWPRPDGSGPHRDALG